MRIERWKFPVAVGLLASFCVLTGCEDASPLGRRPISGDVTLDGQPMGSGSISFRPQGNQGIGSGGPIQDGHYQIEAAKGLLPGEYIVRITSPVLLKEEKKASSGLIVLDPKDIPKPVERVPKEYNAESILRATVTADADNLFDFDINTTK